MNAVDRILSGVEAIGYRQHYVTRERVDDCLRAARSRYHVGVWLLLAEQVVAFYPDAPSAVELIT